MQALLAYIKGCRVSLAVIVEDIARLGRDVSAVISLRVAITKAGGKPEVPERSTPPEGDDLFPSFARNSQETPAYFL